MTNVPMEKTFSPLRLVVAGKRPNSDTPTRSWMHTTNKQSGQSNHNVREQAIMMHFELCKNNARLSRCSHTTVDYAFCLANIIILFCYILWTD